MRSWFLFGGLAVALLVPTALIAQKERVLQHGTLMLLPLGSRDPRSLMQGDYMDLSYEVSREASPGDLWPSDGRLVMRVGEDGVAHFVRRDDGTVLGPGEHLLRYRRRHLRLRIGAEQFFFQEGTAERYALARFGELRVTSGGDAVLVGLADAERRPLGARAFAPGTVAP